MSKKDEKNAKIYAEVVMISRTGTSVLKNTSPLDIKKLMFYQAESSSVDHAKKKLTDAGFTVVASSKFGISIVGSKDVFEQYFKTSILQRPVQQFFGENKLADLSPFFMTKKPEVPEGLATVVDSVYIPSTGYFLAGEGPIPNPAYYHVNPDDISRLTGADAAHNRNYRGNGVKVAMIDSGFIADHDYYTGRGYNVTVHAVIGSITKDEYGHGTGIASNLLAVAPACEFHFIKMTDGVNWATLAAFRMAVSLGVKVISISWGQSRDPVLEAEIQNAVQSGITVSIACGNGGQIGWPGCMPEIISVGGAYPHQNGTWEASSYASSGISSPYPTRTCPDVCGVVGQALHGIFIVMPTMKGSQFDALFSSDGDGTGPADGWLVASGTSSAAPQVAGAAALLLNAKASLSPAEIKQVLEDTAIDITTGASANGDPAGIGPDIATGAGMINIGAAVNKVAPLYVCPRPILKCPLFPIRRCPPAPLRCPPIPIYRCPPLPIIRCPPIPIITCPPAPVTTCGSAPIAGCVGGPIIQPPTRPEGDPMVQVIIEVPKSTADAWLASTSQQSPTRSEAETYAQEAAKNAYDAALKELGVAGEYSDFPDLKGSKKGAFDPKYAES